MIQTIWHSRKGRTRETIKRLVVVGLAGGLLRGGHRAKAQKIFTAVEYSECQCNDEHIHSTNQDGVRTTARASLSYVSELLGTDKNRRSNFASTEDYKRAGVLCRGVNT